MIATALNVQCRQVEISLSRITKQEIANVINDVRVHLLSNLNGQSLDDGVNSVSHDFIGIEERVSE